MTIEEFIKNYIITNEKCEFKDKGYLAQHPLFNQVSQQTFLIDVYKIEDSEQNKEKRAKKSKIIFKNFTLLFNRLRLECINRLVLLITVSFCLRLTCIKVIHL